MKLIFSLLFVLFSYNYIYSQNSIGLNDTTINRAVLNKIPIYGKIDESSDSKFSFCFSFNSLVIDIKEVVVDESSNLSLIDNFDIKLNNFVNSEVIVHSSGLKNNNSGVLFYLVIEGLAGSDTTTLIEPSCFLINDVVSSNITYNNGRINVLSNPIIIDFKESLSLNSPNPFYNETKATFIIENDTKVSFKIYSLNGRKVLNQSFDDIGFVYDVLNSAGSKINDPDNYTYTTGKYQLILRADSWKASAGSYFLVMTTANSVHKLNLMLIK